MNILINASNLKAGGGLQVADSICRELYKYPHHQFVVVLSSFFLKTKEAINSFPNVKNVLTYNVKNNISTLLFGRDSFLDNVIRENKVEIVLTVFGPSRWNPKCLHLSGVAIPYLVLPESPYFQRLSKLDFIKSKLHIFLWWVYFKRSTKFFYTENSFISSRVEKLFVGSNVYTVTNYYNQVFDNPHLWVEKRLPKFNGITLLDIASYYPHKNMEISIDIARYLIEKYPGFNFRFVFTTDKNKFPSLDSNLESHFLFIGKVNIDECPSLYQQSDIAFQPSLLECFTATYPEAMIMRKPIVTTNLPFAQGPCGDAAVYFDPLSAEQAAEQIYEISTNKLLQNQLIENGIEQLNKFDSYHKRADKLIDILEKIVRERNN